MQVVNEGLYVQGMLNRIQADMANASVGLSKLVAEVTHAFVDGQISEETATRLHEEIDARRKRQSNASDALSRVGFHITAPVETTKPVSAPKVVTPESAFQAADRVRRKTRLIRRRYLARVASMPAVVAQQFTIAEQAVLSQVAVRCRDHGRCDLSVSSLSKRANVCERMVQNTIRKAERLRFVAVQYRRRLTNIVTVALEAWRDWWKGTPKAENQKSLLLNNLREPPRGANSVPVTRQGKRKPKLTHDQIVARDIAQVVATMERKVEAKPVPAKPRPKSVGKAVDDHLDAAKALVEKVAQTRPVSDVDPWDRPEVEPWMSPWDRQWMADKEIVEPLSRYPKVRTERGAITEEVQRWLAERWGAPGRLYSIHTFFKSNQGTRDVDRRIGFASSRDAMEFKLRWRT